MTRNRVIGRDNALPWQLPDEMRHFVRTTLGKPVIMGRKQFEAMGKPLPKRTNIVLSRNARFAADGIVVVRTLDEAIERARQAGGDEAMVIGGAEIYALALPRADRLYFTLIDADIDGDTYFPQFDASRFREVRREDHGADARHPYAYSIRVLDRIR
jgi:dihydrofolate reductase